MSARAPRRIESEAELRRIIGEPTELVASKVVDHLNDVTRRFVTASPFVCVATAAAAGGLDVSPRGGDPGFVRVLDERTLLLPDRPGNRLADTLTNLLRDERIALLFLIPGSGDTFRVNGRGWITDDAELLAGCAERGSAPRLGILVTMDEAYTQCAKAIIRSRLWDPTRHVAPGTLPSTGEMFASLRAEDFDAAGYDRERAARYGRGEGL